MSRAQCARAPGRTENLGRGGRRRLAVMAAEYPETFRRPKTFGECQSMGLGTEVPCPFVGCARHLYLEVDDRFEPTPSIKFNHPDKEPDELAETCSLVVAARGGESYARLGPLLNLTRERMRQIERDAFASLDGAVARSLAGVEDRGEDAEHDDGSGARTVGEAVEGLVDLSGREW